MTETIWDIYGWDSPEMRAHMASRWTWCVKHKEPYEGHVTTAGIYYWCSSCDREQMERIFGKDLNDDSRV